MFKVNKSARLICDWRVLRAELESNEVANVAKQRLALLHGGENGGEGVIDEDNVRGLSGDVLAAFTHCNSNVGGLEGEGVVHTVSRHGYNQAALLDSLRNTKRGLRPRGKLPASVVTVPSVSRKGWIFPIALNKKSHFGLNTYLSRAWKGATFGSRA